MREAFEKGKRLGHELFCQRPLDSLRICSADSKRCVVFPKKDIFSMAMCGVWEVACENNVEWQTNSTMDVTAFLNSSWAIKSFANWEKFREVLVFSDFYTPEFREVVSYQQMTPRLMEACERVALWDSGMLRFLNQVRKPHDPMWDAQAALRLAAAAGTWYHSKTASKSSARRRRSRCRSRSCLP